MGKPTGFMDYKRQDKIAETPLERIQHLTSSIRRYQRKNRNFREHAVWRAEFHSVSQENYWQDGKRMSAPQFSTGME